jgi:hypothetical protein
VNEYTDKRNITHILQPPDSYFYLDSLNISVSSSDSKIYSVIMIYTELQLRKERKYSTEAVANKNLLFGTNTSITEVHTVESIRVQYFLIFETSLVIECYTNTYFRSYLFMFTFAP